MLEQGPILARPLASCRHATTNVFNDLRTLFPESRMQVFSLWPGNDFDATRRQKRNDFNTWLWNTFWPGKSLITQHNHSPLLQDGANPDGLNPSYTTDGIHLTVEAARLIGDAVFANMLKPAPIVHPLGLLSDPTNLLPASRLFTGTTGQAFNAKPVPWCRQAFRSMAMPIAVRRPHWSRWKRMPP